MGPRVGEIIRGLGLGSLLCLVGLGMCWCVFDGSVCLRVGVPIRLVWVGISCACWHVPVRLAQLALRLAWV